MKLISIKIIFNCKKVFHLGSLSLITEFIFLTATPKTLQLSKAGEKIKTIQSRLGIL